MGKTGNGRGGGLKREKIRTLERDSGNDEKDGKNETLVRLRKKNIGRFRE